MAEHRTKSADARACIWMEAGVIKYRLCDRAYECDDCPLDIGLRGASVVQPASREVNAPVPETVRLHRSHLWINRTGTDEWTMGLDRHALFALEQMPQVSLPRAGRRIRTGEEALALVVDDEALRWRMPMNALVLERNDRWTTHPEALREKPYTAGWMLLVKSAMRPTSEIWKRAETLKQTFESEHSAIKDLILSQDPSALSAGQTATDGGLLTVPPERLIAKSIFLSFLRERWELLPTGGRF